MKAFTFLLGLIVVVLLPACSPESTKTVLTVEYDLPHPIASLGTPNPEVNVDPGGPSFRVIRGTVSDGGTHPDALRGTLLAIDGRDPADEVRFHFLSPGHAGTEVVTLERVHFSGNMLSADYQVVTPDSNTSDFQQFASQVVIIFR